MCVAKQLQSDIPFLLSGLARSVGGLTGLFARLSNSPLESVASEGEVLTAQPAL